MTLMCRPRWGNASSCNSPCLVKPMQQIMCSNQTFTRSQQNKFVKLSHSTWGIATSGHAIKAACISINLKLVKFVTGCTARNLHRHYGISVCLQVFSEELCQAWSLLAGEIRGSIWACGRTPCRECCNQAGLAASSDQSCCAC